MIHSDNLPTGSTTGLVLEGGAMRGLFSAGIIDVMMEHELWPNGVIGVSAGAAFGCNMKSEQAGRAIRYNKRFATDWRYCSLRSLLKTGDLYGGDFCYHQIPLYLDPFDIKSFNNSGIDFYTVCTDVDSGLPVYTRHQQANFEFMEWVRASASMPLAAKIVNIQGRKLLDGGIADSIPLRHFQKLGYARNIVVLTQPRNYVKRNGKINRLIRLKYRRYPRFVEACLRRAEMYNAELEYIRQEEAAGRVLVMAPMEKLPVNHICHDSQALQETYELGRQQAETRLEEIRRFMK